MRLPLLLTSFVALSVTGRAQGPDVGIVAAASVGSSDCRFTDVEAKLLATGLIGSVGVINTTSVTPTLADLQQFDAVISWTNTTPQDNVAWGDVMADYVDGGGGVVVAVFANSSANADRNLAGRWATDGYEVISSLGGNAVGSASLGTVHQPAHPVMDGVSEFGGGSASFRPSTLMLWPGSTAVAEWDDGRTLVAEGASSRRIDLGFFPPSAACDTSFWDPATDGALLMANALAYVADGSLGANYCSAKSSSTGAPAVISASGSASFAANDLVLHAEPVPDQNGIFFYGPGQQQIPFGNGFLCVTPTFGRLPIELATGGVLSHSYDNTAPPNLHTQVSPGTTWYFQAWFRDPAAGGANFNFSDGLELTYGP